MNYTYAKTLIKKKRGFFEKNYYIIIGILSCLYAAYLFITNAADLDKVFGVLFAFAAFACSKDIRRDINWKSFLKVSAPLLIFIFFLTNYGYAIWHQILIINWNRGHQISLNDTFSKIPYNNAAFARVFKAPWLTWYMRLVYNTGFILCALIPVLRAAVGKDFKKMLRYAFSAHFFQIFLILPFYRLFMLQEVWYVLGEPDGLARTFASEAIKKSWVMHCFPSMHTSVAFAMFLVVLKEKDKIFKFVWSIYCWSIIYSTMYLEVHWTIDVLSGLLLGYLTVKLVDWVLKKLVNKFGRKMKGNDFYYPENDEAA